MFFTINNKKKFLPSSADLVSLPVVASSIWISALNTATNIMFCFHCFLCLFFVHKFFKYKMKLINSNDRNQNREYG